MDQLTRRTRRIQTELLAKPPMRIGQAELSPSTCELIGRTARCKLEPRVLRVLIALAEAAPGAVSRDELFVKCWDGIFVEESALNRSIAQVRRALREAGADCQVETLPKIGYRLVSAPA